VGSQYSSHPEIKAIGIVFSPRPSTVPVQQPTNNGQYYRSKVNDHVEAGHQ
jgi:hypothetical protein